MRPEPSELQHLVQDLHQQATPWLPAGCGSRLSWGPDVQPGPDRDSPVVVSTERLNRIIEFSPGDFTVTVQAGTRLQELQAALAEHRQWLALDWPWGSGPGGSGGGSVGGLVARGLAGGYRQRYLGVRDQLLGIGLLRADGTAARAGGKVVKNVAGYDLMRLLTGSWGSLALITEVTLRTLPEPPQRRGLWLGGPADGLAAMARWLLDSSLSPERIDWQRLETQVSASAPDPAPGEHALGLLVVLASISIQTLEEQLLCIAEKAREAAVRAEPLTPEALERQLWGARGAAESPRPSPQPSSDPDWLLQIGVPASRVDSLLAEASLSGLPLAIGAGTGLGSTWAAGSQLPAYRVEQLRRRCGELGGYLTVLQQPSGSAIPAWLDAPSRPLIEAIKRQFDPKQQLARGRLPGVQPRG